MDIGSLHPQIVHFVIAPVVLGVLFRLVSLIRGLRWTDHTATVLLLFSMFAAFVAVKSGDDAHGPAERIPGARSVVEEHEAWGERTRNLLILIGLVELGIVAVSRRENRQKLARGMRIASAALGVVAIFFVYETGEEGGEIVYEYAGGVGTRSGEPADIGNLLIAGLYNKALQDRELGRKQDAARLVEEMVRQRPQDPEIQLYGAESLLLDRNDPQSALAMLSNVTIAPNNERLRIRAGLLLVDTYEAAGQPDSARVVLNDLKQQYPNNPRVSERQVGAPAAPAPSAPAPGTAPQPTPDTAPLNGAAR